MINYLETIAVVMLAIPLYSYIGYPLLLVVLRYILPAGKVNKKEIFPKVSLMISCFNEEDIIRDKIENSLSLDYPQDKLEIIVVSDASTDRTDEIVGEYAGRGVRLVRQNENLGKTSGLNLAVPQTTGEIIVFSDANAMYKTDAVRKLVSNFNDDTVGYAVGEARYKDSDMTAASRSETTYWMLEIFMKRLESHVHSVVGGDGAIYAIRRGLYEELLATDINDFVNPLQIILRGYRGVYEEEAVCTEEAAGDFRKEYYRKTRIINRSFSGLLRMKAVLNPFRTGIFSLEIISHKLLRWIAPFFLMIFVLSSIALSISGVKIFQWITVMMCFFFICSYAGYLLSRQYAVWLVFYYPYYFVLVSLASVIGICRSLRGEIQTTWSTVRASEKEDWDSYSWTKVIIHVCFFITLWILVTTAGEIAGIPLLAERAAYWMLIMTVCYVYFGYPLSLAFLSRYHSVPVMAGEIFPDVTLLVCAYNEEEVIGDKIENSLGLDYPAGKLEIVIASDGSTDRTNEIVRRYRDKGITLMEYPERSGKVTVINRTVPRVRSEIVVFSDANTMYQADSIKKLVRNFADPSVGAVSADVILHNEETTFGRSESLYYRYERWIQSRESDTGSIIGADGGMYAIRRRLFEPPSRNIILDDFVISMNVALSGHRLVYEKEAIGHEKSSSSSNIEFLRKSRVIAGAIQSVMQKEGVPLMRQKTLFFCYVSHKYLRWMVPIILIALLPVNIRLCLVSQEMIYRWTLIAQMSFYALAASDLLFPKRKKPRLTSIPFYFCMVNGAALYGIYKGLFKKQPVKWEKFSREMETV